MAAENTEVVDLDVATVLVAGNFQVSHEGQVHGPGETVQVPREVAAKWLESGFVTPG